MDAPSPNNNNDKKMSAGGTSSSALTKQGPKKNTIIPPTSSLLNLPNKSTSRKPSMLVKKSFVPSSSKSLMKKPTTSFLTMRPTKNLLGTSNNKPKNSLLKKRSNSLLGVSNNKSNKKIINPTSLSSMSATASSILGGGGSNNISGGRSSVAASMPTAKPLTIVGPVSKKQKEEKFRMKRNDMGDAVKIGGGTHKNCTTESRAKVSSRVNALIDAGTFHSHKARTKSHLVFEALELAAKNPKNPLHNNCGPEIDGDWQLLQSPRFFVSSLVWGDLASELDFTSAKKSAKLREFLGSYGIEGTSSYGTKNNCPHTGKAGSSQIKWSETAEQFKIKPQSNLWKKKGIKLWFTIHRPTCGPHAA